MKRILILLGIMLLLVNTASAIILPSQSSIYLDVNTTYPLVLIPLDNNVWNITLNVYDGNWSYFNFTFDGEQYNLNILFLEVGDYPFVINSTEVNGTIEGTFLVRKAYEVTFEFFRDRQSYPFFSNKYINEMSYVTAELTGTQNMFQNNYNPTLESFVAPLVRNEDRKPVWYAEYKNGVAVLKLYESGKYAIRLIDGQITFNGEYSQPNITKSYGTNSFIGLYDLNGSESYKVLVTKKDLYPYKWLLNWLLIIGLIIVFFVSVALFFLIPEIPSVSFYFGIGFSVLLIFLRLILLIFVG